MTAGHIDKIPALFLYLVPQLEPVSFPGPIAFDLLMDRPELGIDSVSSLNDVVISHEVDHG